MKKGTIDDKPFNTRNYLWMRCVGRKLPTIIDGLEYTSQYVQIGDNRSLAEADLTYYDYHDG